MKALRFVCSLVVLPALLILATSQLAAAATVSFSPQLPMPTGEVFASSVAIGDLNGDGIPDLVVTNRNTATGDTGTVSIFLGLGKGKFQAPVLYNTGGSWAYSVAIADVNGDGRPDLIVANNNSASVGVLLGNGDGTFQAAVPYSTAGAAANSVAIGDVNGDGMPDLVVAVSRATGEDGAVLVLLGNGNGTFQAPVIYDSGGESATFVAIADLNGDGKLDLAVTNTCESGCGSNVGAVSILLGNGDGTFQTAVPYSTVGYDAVSVAISDVNGDGKPDLIVANQCYSVVASRCTPTGGFSVLLGNGHGTFQAAVQHGSGGWLTLFAAVADVNGDGKPDLAVLNECQGVNSNGGCQGDNVLSVFAGNRDGTFQTPVNYLTGGAPYGNAPAGVAIGDLNRDGRADIVAVINCSITNQCYGSVRVVLNTYSTATTTVVTSSLNPAPINQTVTFTSTTTSSSLIPNGTVVAFYNGTAKIGTGSTSKGVATLTTSFAKAGTFTIKATFPVGGYLKSSSGIVKQMITQ